MEVVVGDGTHTREAGGGRVVSREAQSLNRDGGAAATLISFFIGGQFKPGRGMGVSHVSVFLLHGSTLFICTHGYIVSYSRALLTAGGVSIHIPNTGQRGGGGMGGGGGGQLGWVRGQGRVPVGAGRGGTGAGGGFRDSRGPVSGMAWVGRGVEGGGEGAVVDSVDDIILGDGITVEGGLPVDSLGGLVGVSGLTTGSKNKLFEGDPSG
jgi:hypothetical protein